LEVSEVSVVLEAVMELHDVAGSSADNEGLM